MKKLAIGEDDFKVLRENDYYFVDKSHFVKDVIEDASRVLLFPRPRRFGKTLNMSMLNYFFNHNNAQGNRKLFKGLEIEKKLVFEEHQGKYPVISISMKELKSKNYAGFKSKLQKLLSELYQQHEYLLEKDGINVLDKKHFIAILEGKADTPTLEFSLKLLSRLIFQYHQQKTVVLIDEYDTPVHESYLNSFYFEVIDFMRNFLGNALKGNDYLQKGVITGILRVSKESMFSDLNNVMVYSVLSKDYNNAFGFTQKETDQILNYYGLEQLKDQVKNWYNGYYFGDEEIYNPWSILSFTRNKGEFRSYWLSTSANELVQKLIKDSDNNVKQDIEDMLNGKVVRSNIVDNISFPGLQASRENILSFFVQTGYLKALYKEMQNDRMFYEISLPNSELKLIYADTIKFWFDESIGSSNLNEMLKALISGDIELFGEILSSFVVNYLSYYNTSQDQIEKVYHAFLLGMLIQLQGSYRIESERESGYGRVDVLMTPEDKSRPGIIMELKKIRVSENKDSALAAALAQIEERQYETLLRQQGYQHIMILAVTFDGKRVWVKRG